MPKLRVGIVNYLNSKPLAWGFLKGHHADLFAPIRPNGNPPGIVEKGVGKDLGSGVVLALVKGANFHGRDLLLTGCFRPENRVIAVNEQPSAGSSLRARTGASRSSRPRP